MALYVYYCPNCNCEQELIHKISQDPEVICQNCGNFMKRKLCGAGLIKFNGPGFYETDYKHKGEVHE